MEPICDSLIIPVNPQHQLEVKIQVNFLEDERVQDYELIVKFETLDDGNEIVGLKEILRLSWIQGEFPFKGMSDVIRRNDDENIEGNCEVILETIETLKRRLKKRGVS